MAIAQYKSTHRCRRAIALLEISVATILAAALLTLCVQMLAATALQERAIDRRQAALQQAANAMERCTALAWSEVNNQRLAQVVHELDERQPLAGKLAATVDDSTGPPAAKRITIQVHLTNRSGGTDAPVQLISWIYQR